MGPAVTVVGVTGGAGFFGWHLRCRLFTEGIEHKVADRATFSSEDALDEFVRGCDVVAHIAGVNRANDDDAIIAGNVGLAQQLIDARERTGSSFDVVYANSIKADEPGPYGDSKRRAAELLADSAAETGTAFTNVLFPHLYGEFGRPNYNSVVSTFAHQLVNGEPSTVSDGELELIHVQDACDVVLDAVANPANGEVRPSGRRITVRAVYERLERLAGYVAKGVFPEVEDDEFELRLFNTIRSQMWPDGYPISLVRHADSRGAFFEVVRAWGQGQTSISTTVPGITRGEHYHLDKVERFVVVSGEAEIRVRRLFTDVVHTYDVSGEAPVVIDMPTLCTHDITNTGEGELVTLFWSHDHFDPEKADTYPLPVVGESLPA